MKKILVINVMATYSLGGRAVIKGFINAVKTSMPDAEITFMSSHFLKEKELYKKWDYKNTLIIDHFWYSEFANIFATILVSGVKASAFSMKILFGLLFPWLNPYKNFDIIIDLTTDGPNDHYTLSMTLFSLVNTYFATLSKKPVVICAASIGAFKRRTTLILSKLILNRVNLIMLREEISKQYLKKIGINKPEIEKTADLAFLMDPASYSTINKIIIKEGIFKISRPVVGISLSSIIHQYGFKEIENRKEKDLEYIRVMTKLIIFLIENRGCSVVLIPHSSAQQFGTAMDDREISRKIFDTLRESSVREKLYLLSGDYDADELKGLIGICDYYIAFRMHASIAAFSMLIPTVSVVYGHKSNGIIGIMLDRNDCIIEIGKYRSEELFKIIIEKFDYVTENKDKIRESLNSKLEGVKKNALDNAIYIKHLIEMS
jgi:colanic acid/amylovoran biosynthesis protein